MKKRTTFTERLIALALFAPTATVLAIAMNLKPDPSGMGTHQQLGLSPCGFLEVTTLPCPMCGMTTTFTHLAHFEILAGIINQPFGVFLFLMTLFVAIISLLDLLAPKQRITRFLRWVEPYEFRFALFFIGAMILGWLYKIILVLY